MANSYNSAKHIVAESSRLKATTAGHIYDVVLHEQRDNGTVVSLDGLNASKGVQCFTSKDVADVGPIYLVLQVPSNYDTTRKAMNEEQWFYNASGDVVRAYELYEDDIFTITYGANGGTEYGIDAASTAPEVGNYVYFDNANNIWKESADVPAAADVYNCFGQIVELVTYQNATAARIRVLELHKTVVSAVSAG